jgi:hypothetical protein
VIAVMMRRIAAASRSAKVVVPPPRRRRLSTGSARAATAGGRDILALPAGADASRYDHAVTEPPDRHDASSKDGGGGDARASEAGVRKVVRQIEALRQGAGPRSATPAEATDVPASGAGGIPGQEAQRPCHPALREIERLRAARARRTKDLSIIDLVARAQKQAADVHRRLGELIELWDANVPEDIAAHTSLTAMRGGVLHVAVDSSAIAYELDRLLREGLDVRLRQQYRRTLTRVKVTLAPMKPLQH